MRDWLNEYWYIAVIGGAIVAILGVHIWVAVNFRCVRGHVEQSDMLTCSTVGTMTTCTPLPTTQYVCDEYVKR